MEKMEEISDFEEEKFHNSLHLDDIKRHASGFPIIRDALLLARWVEKRDWIISRGNVNICRHCYGDGYPSNEEDDIKHNPDCSYIRATSIMDRLRELSK